MRWFCIVEGNKNVDVLSAIPNQRKWSSKTIVANLVGAKTNHGNILIFQNHVLLGNINGGGMKLQAFPVKSAKMTSLNMLLKLD